MRDKELWLNGSGYPDPTAYNAMKGMVDHMGNAGEIWEVNTHKGTKKMLLVAEKNKAYSMLELLDEPTDHTTLCVAGYHTNTICLTYGLEGRLATKVDELSEDEFGDVRESIGRALDIPMMPVTDFVRAAHDNTLMKDAEIKELTKKIEELTAENAGLMLDNGDLKERLEKIKETPIFLEDTTVLKTERDLYKQLYEQALERLIAR